MSLKHLREIGWFLWLVMHNDISKYIICNVARFLCDSWCRASCCTVNVGAFTSPAAQSSLSSSSSSSLALVVRRIIKTL